MGRQRLLPRQTCFVIGINNSAVVFDGWPPIDLLRARGGMSYYKTLRKVQRVVLLRKGYEVVVAG